MTLKQIATIIQVPESTVRLYRDEFVDFIPAIGEGRRRRYEHNAVEVLRSIVAMKKEGVAGANIRIRLARTNAPEEKRRNVTQQDALAGISLALEEQRGEVALLRVELAAMRNELSRLVTLLDGDKQGALTMEQLQRDMHADRHHSSE